MQSRSQPSSQVCGSRQLALADLEGATQYDDGYTRDSEVRPHTSALHCTKAARTHASYECTCRPLRLPLTLAPPSGPGPGPAPPIPGFPASRLPLALARSPCAGSGRWRTA